MKNRAIFEHRVSKGSRFNQIYIPREMGQVFEVGDVVEVRLVSKKEQIYYSKSLRYIKPRGSFKESLIKQIFSLLGKFKEIKQIFIVGSFLTQGTDYNDIDIIFITDKSELEERAFNYLSEEMQLKFHILGIPESKFGNLIKTDPLTRSMLYYFASNRKFELSEETEIDKKHMEFLLMMPEDLLKISVSRGRAYYDSLRRIIAVRKFLENQNLDPLRIDKELKSLLGEDFYASLRKNEPVGKELKNKIKNMIKRQLKQTRERLK